MGFFQFDQQYRSFFRECKISSAKDSEVVCIQEEDTVCESSPWTEMIRRSGFCRKKYKLWEETQGMCIYCGKSILVDDFINGNESDIEHIIPQALGGSSEWNNLTCSCRQCNRSKGDLTAMDYMRSQSSATLQDYLRRLRFLISAGLITKEKYINLMTPKTLLFRKV